MATIRDKKRQIPLGFFNVEVARPTVELDLDTYDRIVITFSGGKDSLATILLVLSLGYPKERIEIHHHDVDGRGQRFMDWPCTRPYVRAVCAALGLKLYESWRVDGFLGEMERDGQSKPIAWQTTDGTVVHMPADRSDFTRRFQYPQTGNDMKTRWCSPYLKIDVLRRLINNEERFLGGRTLVVTGERSEESNRRRGYEPFFLHHSDSRTNKTADTRRHVDAWRPIHAWTEVEVWKLIEQWRLNPHPAYRLGWPRVSCRECIFGDEDQWATVRAIYPDSFVAKRAKEIQYGKTMDIGRRTLDQIAAQGTPYAAALASPELAAMADSEDWDEPVFVDDWTMPAGAFGHGGGPT